MVALTKRYGMNALNSPTLTDVCRMDRMTDFRNGITRILISSDLLGRGIDVPNLNLLVQYDIALNMDTYMRRVSFPAKMLFKH